MKSYKLVAALAVFTIIMLAAAAAYAEPGDSGTVYGQATMQPTVSIAISGQGSADFMPLDYEGRSGQNVTEVAERTFTVSNTGDAPVALMLGYGSDPSDGSDVWYLRDYQDTNACTWTFFCPGGVGYQAVPSSSGSPRYLGSLDVDSHADVQTYFGFPINFTNGNTHSMTAIIYAGEPI